MKTNLHLTEYHVIVLFQRRNMCLKPKSGVRRVFSLSLFTAGFAGLLTHLNCLNGLRYMLNFNMPFVFYQPPANVCSAEIREQSYHVINFGMVGFSKCGRRAWHVGGFGSLVNCVVCDFSI